MRNRTSSGAVSSTTIQSGGQTTGVTNVYDAMRGRTAARSEAPAANGIGVINAKLTTLVEVINET